MFKDTEQNIVHGTPCFYNSLCYTIIAWYVHQFCESAFVSVWISACSVGVTVEHARTASDCVDHVSSSFLHLLKDLHI